MNSRMRQRAKAHMPMVLLTLLSIIQALAPELTWEHIREQPYLLELTLTAALGWLQIATTLLGILLAAAAISYQIFLNARYWQQAMALDDEPDPI